MTTLTYKDYQGSVSYEDGSLVIQVLHVEDTLITECERASGVQAAFEDLVDDYLETCAHLGKEPQKAFKGSFNVRMPPETHRSAAMAAATAGETLNAWVVSAIVAKL